MTKTRTFSMTEAAEVAARIGINFDAARFGVGQFQRGLNVEIEHGLEDDRTNVTNNDPDLTGKIAWAHLNEFPDYYTRLEAMEAEAHAYWDRRKPD